MRVFISYSSLDRCTAEEVHAALQRAGFDVWRDQTRLESDWSREIAFALSRSQALCLIWSDAANSSIWVRHEWVTARALQIPIVPYVLKPAPALPSALANVHHVPQSGGATHDELTKRLTLVAPHAADYDYTVLPPRSYLPFIPNPAFVGRRQDLVELYLGLVGNLQRIGTNHVGCSGMGGIGKTQLLVEAAYRFSFAFDGVFWIDGTNPNTWAEQLVRIARDYLGLQRPDGSEPQSMSEYVAALHRYGKERPGQLLIVDDVSDPRSLHSNEVLPGDMGLTVLTLGFSILFSSRSRHVPPGVTLHSVAALSDSAAFQLLTFNRPVVDAEDEAGAVEISRLLGNLPLALALAAGFLAKYRSVSFERYAQELADNKLQILDIGDIRREDLPTRHESAVRATLSSQWSALNDQHTKQLFLLIGQFPEGALVPKARLNLFAGPASSDSRLVSPWDRAATLLEELNLAESGEAGKSIRFHSLVHAFARSLISADEQRALRSEAAIQVGVTYDDLWVLADNHRERGIDAVFEDVVYGKAWCPTTSASIARYLDDLERTLARERHHLFPGPDFIQQLQIRASLLQLDELSRKLCQALEQREGLGFHLVVASKISDRGIRRTYVWADARARAGSTLRPKHDARELLASNWDHLSLWDLESGAVREFSGHRSYLFDIAWIDDHTAGSVDRDGVLIRWNLTTEEAKDVVALPEIDAHKDQEELKLTGFSLSSGCRFAIGVWDNRETVGWDSRRTERKAIVALWDLEQMRRTRVFEFNGHVNTCKLSDDGRTIVVADNAEPIMKMWDAVNGRLLKSFEGRVDSIAKVLGISTIVFGRGNQSIVTAVHERVVVWDVATGQIRHVLRGHSGMVSALCFDAEDNRIISAGQDGIRIWSADSGELHGIGRGQSGTIVGIANLTGSTALFSASSRSLIQWDMSEIANEADEGHASAVLGLTATPDGTRVLSSSSDGIILWDRRRGFRPMRLELPFEFPEYITIDEYGSFDKSDQYPIQLRNDRCPVTIFPDGERAAIAGDQGEISIVQIATGRKELALEHHTSQIRALATSPDGRHLFSADYAYNLVVWDLEAERPVRKHRSEREWLIAAELTVDGRCAVIGGESGSVLCWNLETGELTERLPASKTSRKTLRGKSEGRDAITLIFPEYQGQPGVAVNCLALSASTETILIGFSNDQPAVCTFDSEQIKHLDHRGHSVTAAAMSPDGELVFTGTSSGLIGSWHAESASLLALLRLDAGVCRMILSDDRLVVGDTRGQLLFFELHVVDDG